jgi:uncharacterized membrane protein
VTTVFGIEIPSNSPVFLTIVGVHVFVALICVCTGPVAMLSRKGPGRHPTFGTVYYWGLCVVFLSATVLALMRWAEDYHLFFLGAVSFAVASLGRAARRGRWQGWVPVHISGMGLSYVVLLTAFYVDNGKSLPVWRDLPPITYWLMPGVVGIPLIVRAVARYSRTQLP